MSIYPPTDLSIYKITYWSANHSDGKIAVDEELWVPLLALLLRYIYIFNYTYKYKYTYI